MQTQNQSLRPLRIVASLLMTLALAVPACAETARGDGFALDFHVGDAHGDFNLGVGIKSPTFLDVFNLEALGDVAWKEANAASSAGPLEWNPYGTIKLGLNVEAPALQGIGRLYTGVGGLLVIAGATSSTPVGGGAYGIFGFEFYLLQDQSWSYFVELGGNLSFANADLLSGNPSLQNGFSINSGVRLHF